MRQLDEGRRDSAAPRLAGPVRDPDALPVEARRQVVAELVRPLLAHAAAMSLQLKSRQGDFIGVSLLSASRQDVLLMSVSSNHSEMMMSLPARARSGRRSSRGRRLGVRP